MGVESVLARHLEANAARFLRHRCGSGLRGPELGALLLEAEGGVAVLASLEAATGEEAGVLEEVLEGRVRLGEGVEAYSYQAHINLYAYAYRSGEGVPVQPSLLSRLHLVLALEALPPQALVGAARQALQEPRAGGLQDYVVEAGARELRCDLLPDEVYGFLEHLYAQRARLPVPVGPRVVEAVARLAEARARMRLAGKVEREDMLDALSLVERCWQTLGYQPPRARGRRRRG
jgi:hypothetical protein